MRIQDCPSSTHFLSRLEDQLSQPCIKREKDSLIQAKTGADKGIVEIILGLLSRCFYFLFFCCKKQDPSPTEEVKAPSRVEYLQKLKADYIEKQKHFGENKKAFKTWWGYRFDDLAPEIQNLIFQQDINMREGSTSFADARSFVRDQYAVNQGSYMQIPAIEIPKYLDALAKSQVK